MAREVIDAPAVTAAGARLRSCGDQVPRRPSPVNGIPVVGELSVGTEVARLGAVWGDGLWALRAELGLLASALQRASWARQDLERVTAQLISDGPCSSQAAAPAVGGPR